MMNLKYYRYIQHELNRSIVVAYPNVPAQANTNDCGLHVIFMAWRLIEEAPLVIINYSFIYHMSLQCQVYNHMNFNTGIFNATVYRVNIKTLCYH